MDAALACIRRPSQEMKEFPMRFAAAVVLAVILPATILPSSALAAPPVVSNFEFDAEGWSIVDLNCTNYSAVATFPVDWFPVGGLPGGHIGAEDPSSNCYFFEAPAAYLGDRSAFVGRSLRFALRTTLSNYPQGAVLVLAGPSNLRLVHSFTPPTTEWLCYTVPLVNTSFRVGTASGPIASVAQFNSVMAAVAALRISAEHGSIVAETSFLDSVIFGAESCVADFNGDGIVDGADLGALLAAWGSESTVHDLDCDGVVDGADLGALLASWGACPR